MVSESLVTIKEASKILGVSEVALRHWTNEGIIKAFITPGGHRRYSVDELRRITSSQQKLYVMDDFMSSLAGTTGLHGEIARKNFLPKMGADGLDPVFQKQLVELGRKSLQIVVRYVAEPAQRTEIVKTAQELGYAYGQALEKLGLPLTESVAMFIQHREPMIKATSDFIKKNGAVNGRVFSAITLVTQIMDEMLVSLVTGYQHSDGSSTGYGSNVVKQ